MRQIAGLILILMSICNDSPYAWGAFSLETANVPSHLLSRNGSLFFSDKSESPVRKIDIQDGRVAPLVRKMGVPVGPTIYGEDIFWIEERPGISPSGNCTGPGTIRILNKTSLHGTVTTALATGDYCSGGTRDIVVTDDHVFWVISRTTPNAIRMKTRIRLYGSISGHPFDQSMASTYWMAQHIGVVKWTESDEATAETAVLTDTNILVSNLTIYQAVEPDPVIGGESFTNHLVVTNQGPDAATGILLEHAFSSGVQNVAASTGCHIFNGVITCDLGSLSPGASASITIVSNAPANGAIESITGVKSDQADSNPDDNTSVGATIILLDTDGDGILDQAEDVNRNGIVDFSETDPLNPDTDGDGMPDGWELTFQLEPLASDALNDADGDGFTNFEEFLLLTDPVDLNSRPFADIDGDGRVTLADLVLAFRVMAGLGSTPSVRLDYAGSGMDVNGDRRVGMEEAVFLLQRISGKR